MPDQPIPASNPPAATSFFPDGFVGIRSGLFDRLSEGDMTSSMLGVYLILLKQADWKTGVWWGTAYDIKKALGNNEKLSLIRKSIRNLCNKRYVRSMYRQGERGAYPMLLHKYRPSVGDMKGKVLNAWASKSWKELHFDSECVANQCRTSAEPVPDVSRTSAERVPNIYLDVLDSQDLPDVQDVSKKSNHPPTAEEYPDGGVDGSLPPSSEDLRPRIDLVDRFTAWVSDLLEAKAGVRDVPRKTDKKKTASALRDNDPLLLVASAYRFCLRAKGLGGMTHPFTNFWNEFEVHLQDAQRNVSDADRGELYDSRADLLSDLHNSVFEWEIVARKENRMTQSMSIFDEALKLAGLPALDKAQV
jgi:hypothetical protein